MNCSPASNLILRTSAGDNNDKQSNLDETAKFFFCFFFGGGGTVADLPLNN